MLGLEPLPIVKTLRKMLLWSTWGSLIAIWGATIADHCREGEFAPLLVVLFTIIPAWVVLYVAEGLELAVAARPNHPVVSDVHRFFARRQAVVVIVISYVSLVSEYPWIFVPGFGRLTHPFPFVFSLSLVTLTTLWFAQVVPKRLAVIDPERFLSAPFTRPFLLAVDVLGAVFDGPSDDLVRLATRGWPRVAVHDPSATNACACAICAPLPVTVAGWSERTGVHCTCELCNPEPRTAGIPQSAGI